MNIILSYIFSNFFSCSSLFRFIDLPMFLLHYYINALKKNISSMSEVHVTLPNAHKLWSGFTKTWRGNIFFPFWNSLIQKSWLCKCSKTKITDKERIHHVIIPTCNQATKEGTNMSAARKCKISKPCRWWNISNWVSPKLLTESGLLEQLSSDSECRRFSPSPFRKANSSDLSCPFLEFNDSWLWAWLRKEAVKKLLQKQGVTFRNASHLEENISQWHMITDMNNGTMVMTMKKRN